MKPPFLPLEDRTSHNKISKYFDPRFSALPVAESPADRVSMSRDPFVGVGFTYTAPEFLTESRQMNGTTETIDASIHVPKPSLTFY